MENTLLPSFNSGHELLRGGFKSGAVEVSYLEIDI
jgi:hypothetical protein